ncbi:MULTISPECIES: D-aminoacyl-tRNA deacylase [Pseudomonas syringae group]|uniref:D-aminoacyl-tRNA deacylase n=1 Tax=Pseudomonas syringae pv. ribicola TaxID=55398 RepID=A0A0P9YT76_PSESI|nr:MULTISPECIES: D-aminoacyl-tRNA deacylase [Pseudomonas syringae group]MCF9018622.1 D-tyrosyl-tRNA(Tyr) deacylase [Pseudomonas syringae]EKN46446.1 D-tyrosyl-tRNA(Tyr) deacylase [Pseudomonas viridiflava UASWS0038]KPL64463.1 D-tyrosyl-tRNA(Tyr) deacylase [Pseudomonas viridiflava]KPY49233.1 D-tyrosyl-tRNA deacylase [Pseudomonas syringae pv. ribicola]KPZ17748.1 D-tyrosyl-tRNA deacylase [Pseudomonas viridiflava]
MKALLQRVQGARVEVGGEVIGAIDQGILVLVGVEPQDTRASADKLLHKLLNYRVFSDAEGKMNLSLREVGGGLLLVSQFTLAADTKSGMRPSFSKAAPPALGAELYDYLLSQARIAHSAVAAGQFGADMQVHLVNDGPVTFLLET